MSKHFLRTIIGFPVIFLVFTSVLFAQDKGWSCKKIGNNIIRINADGTFFADYRLNYKGTPIVWPICTADGQLISRGYPMIEDEVPDQESCPEMKNVYRNALLALIAEEKDHPHHRSLWFTHGNVNDCDFWALTPDKEIVHTGFDAMTTQDNSVILKTRNNWLDKKNNQIVCSDERSLRFFTIEINGKSIRALDYDIIVHAKEADVHFKDTKEGSFGFRVPGTMDVSIAKRVKKLGVKKGVWGGKIVNSNGQINDDAWGKHADWVDYCGPVPARLDDKALDKYFEKTNKVEFDLKLAGVTIMNHPQSFRYPTWWHVRTYGLFSANPFGQKDFEKSGDGLALIKKGASLTFSYRLIFHDGELTSEQLNKQFKDYSQVKK